MSPAMLPSSPSLKRPRRALGRGHDSELSCRSPVSIKTVLRHGSSAGLTTPQLLSFHLSHSSRRAISSSPVIKKVESYANLTQITDPTAALSSSGGSSVSDDESADEKGSMTSLQRRWMERLSRMDDIDRVSKSSPVVAQKAPAGIPTEIFIPDLDRDCTQAETDDDDDDLTVATEDILITGLPTFDEDASDDIRFSNTAMAAQFLACAMLLFYLMGGSSDYLMVTVVMYTISNLARAQYTSSQ